jgi:hypothetical protein
MKKIMFSIVVLCIGCASFEPIEQSNIINLPGQSKQQIYQKAMQWITYKFVSGRAVMDYKDFNMGRIIAKGNSVLAGTLVEVKLIATIDCVDGKSKIMVNSIDCAFVAPNGNRFPCTGSWVWPKDIENAKNQPKVFIDDYRVYMTSGKAPAWDGK